MSAFAKDLTTSIKQDLAQLRSRGLLTESQYRSILRQLPRRGFVSSYVDVLAEKDEDGIEIGDEYFEDLAEAAQSTLGQSTSQTQSQHQNQSIDQNQEDHHRNPEEKEKNSEKKDKQIEEYAAGSISTTNDAKSEPPVMPFNIAALKSVSRDSFDPSNPAHPKHPDHEEWARKIGERLGEAALFDTGTSGGKVHGNY